MLDFSFVHASQFCEFNALLVLAAVIGFTSNCCVSR